MKAIGWFFSQERQILSLVPSVFHTFDKLPSGERVDLGASGEPEHFWYFPWTLIH